jgi:hypothetical protein
MVSTGNFLRLLGDDMKDYLRIIHHREGEPQSGVNVRWRLRNRQEVSSLFSLLFIFYIERNNNKGGEGKPFITSG